MQITPPPGQRINPAVYAEAERFTDGALTDRVLADVAAMARIPLYIPFVQAPPPPPAADARAALYFATEAVTKARLAYDHQRRQLGFANRAHAARRARAKSAEMHFLNKARAVLRVALREWAAADAAVAAWRVPALRLAA